MQVTNLKTLNFISETLLTVNFITNKKFQTCSNFQKAIFVYTGNINVCIKFLFKLLKTICSFKFIHKLFTSRIGGVPVSPETPYTGNLHCLACNPLTNTFLLGSGSTIGKLNIFNY